MHCSRYILVSVENVRAWATGVRQPTVWAVAKQSLKNDGVKSFYGGVQSTMIGQTVVKGSAFWAYASAQNLLMASVFHCTALGAGGMCLAAMMSGFVASFIVTPVERIN